MGMRGQKRVKRPELVDAHGFDTKYAMHVLRLGHQGIELMTTGRLTLPIPEPARTQIMGVRRGEWSQTEVLGEIARVERELEVAVERSSLPDGPDSARVDAFLVESYREAWDW